MKASYSFSQALAAESFHVAAGDPREIARRLGHSRRDFLRGAAGLALGSALLGGSPFVYGATAAKKRKVIVITFGGGARDQETFAPEGQENIPHMMKELLPQASFFTQVMNQGILGHYVATASLATGVYETLNNFSAVPPDHPTVFEYFRKDLNRPPTDAWVVAPSNGFNRIGESDSRCLWSGSRRDRGSAEASVERSKRRRDKFGDNWRLRSPAPR